MAKCAPHPRPPPEHQPSDQWCHLPFLFNSNNHHFLSCFGIKSTRIVCLTKYMPDIFLINTYCPKKYIDIKRENSHEVATSSRPISWLIVTNEEALLSSFKGTGQAAGTSGGERRCGLTSQSQFALVGETKTVSSSTS